MYASNVEGTRHVIRAATAANVSRIVYTSTVGALGIPHGGVGREDTPSSLATMPGPYKRSQDMAGQAAGEPAPAWPPVGTGKPSRPVCAPALKPPPTGPISVAFL